MMNAIKVGKSVMDANSIESVWKTETAVYVRFKSGVKAEIVVPENGAAMFWWFAAADRVTFYIPGVTVDVVERHREHLEALAAADCARPHLAAGTANGRLHAWENEGGAA